MRIIIISLLINLAMHPVSADVFKVEGDTLIYNTEDTDGVDGIQDGDDDKLLEILQSHRNINLLKIKSSGGEVYVAKDMSDIIIDAQLDTHVDTECISLCVRLLLAGKKRTASPEAQIGISSGGWTAEDLEKHYDTNKEARNWSTPFEFASSLHYDVQEGVAEYVRYFSERGLADYVAGYKYKLGPDETWYMPREELRSSGILTE
jgi:hypothetical protein